jgi:hypothetical protein
LGAAAASVRRLFKAGRMFSGPRATIVTGVASTIFRGWDMKGQAMNADKNSAR